MNEDLTIAVSDLVCFICQDYFCRPYTAVCGHSFCHLCIEEYLLWAEICPICLIKIRDKPINPVSSLGQFVQNFLKSNKIQSQRLEKRKDEIKEYLKRKQLKGVKVGIKLDIRDSNYIWSVGMVTRIISKVGESGKFLVICYMNYMQKKEEEIMVNSDRLANGGFFTKRKDIPSYEEKVPNQIIRKYQN